MSVEYGDYNGHPIIKLKSNDGSPVSLIFGFSKARLILENIDEIKKFVETNGGQFPKVKFHQK